VGVDLCNMEEFEEQAESNKSIIENLHSKFPPLEYLPTLRIGDLPFRKATKLENTPSTV
jgi:hypothetical protein